MNYAYIYLISTLHCDLTIGIQNPGPVWILPAQRGGLYLNGIWLVITIYLQIKIQIALTKLFLRYFFNKLLAMSTRDFIIFMCFTWSTTAFYSSSFLLDSNNLMTWICSRCAYTLVKCMVYLQTFATDQVVTIHSCQGVQASLITSFYKPFQLGE